MSHVLVFREIQARRTRSFVCAGCEKRRSRSRTFTHTVNPFNQSASGAPKTERTRSERRSK